MDPRLQPNANQPGQVVLPSQVAVQSPIAPQPQAAPSADGLSWQASEYVHHDKRTAWHLGLFAIIAVLIAVAVITHEWLSIGVFVVMGVALVIYGNKQPRVLNYTITETGITIGPKDYPFESFKSFSVVQDVAWHVIDLEPTKRFMPRLSILFEDAQLDAIVGALASHLPEEDRLPDPIERLARYLKF